MSNDDYDDGLVHSHTWATEPPLPATGPMRRGAEIAAAMSAHPEEETYDDGLVHCHGWACSDQTPLSQR
jgi:hypothetical protein